MKKFEKEAAKFFVWNKFKNMQIKKRKCRVL